MNTDDRVKSVIKCLKGVKHGEEMAGLFESSPESILKFYEATPGIQEKVFSVTKQTFLEVQMSEISMLHVIEHSQKLPDECKADFSRKACGRILEEVMGLKLDATDLGTSVVDAYKSLFPDGEVDKLAGLIDDANEKNRIQNMLSEMQRIMGENMKLSARICELESGKKSVDEGENEKKLQARIAELEAEKKRVDEEKRQIEARKKAAAEARRAKKIASSDDDKPAAKASSKSAPKRPASPDSDDDKPVAKAAKFDAPAPKKPSKPAKPSAAPAPRPAAAPRPASVPVDVVEDCTQVVDVDWITAGAK